MEWKTSQRFVYAKRSRKSRNIDPTQMAIIAGCLLITSMASLWLPMYFASAALQIP